MHAAWRVGRLLAYALGLKIVQEGIMTVSYDGSLFTYSVPGLSHVAEPHCSLSQRDDRIQHENKNEEGAMAFSRNPQASKCSAT